MSLCIVFRLQLLFFNNLDYFIVTKNTSFNSCIPKNFVSLTFTSANFAIFPIMGGIGRITPSTIIVATRVTAVVVLQSFLPVRRTG